MTNTRNLVWPFFKKEVKDTFLSFFRPFWKSTLIFGVLFAIYLAYKIWTSPVQAGGYQPPHSFGAYILDFLIIFGFSVVYVWPLGVAWGSFSTFWRFFGGWTFLPVLLFPFLIYGMFWLFSGFLFGQGADVLEALKLAFESRGLAFTEQTIGGARVAHAGGPAAIIVMILILPPLLLDALLLVLDFQVLWQLAQFLLSIVGVFCLGAFSSFVISSIPLSIAFVRRLKQRYATFSTS